MSLQRRTQRLEEQTGDGASGHPPIEICYTCPAPGGGTLVEARTMKPPMDVQDCPVRYYHEPDGEGQRRELTREEYESAVRASYARSDCYPNPTARYEP